MYNKIIDFYIEDYPFIIRFKTTNKFLIEICIVILKIIHL